MQQWVKCTTHCLTMKIQINIRKTTKEEKKEFFIGASVLIAAILLFKMITRFGLKL